MSRPRSADKPGWLRVRIRCPRCGGGWWDWLPDGASLRVLQCAAGEIDCPRCSGREGTEADLLAEPDDAAEPIGAQWDEQRGAEAA